MNRLRLILITLAIAALHRLMLMADGALLISIRLRGHATPLASHLHLRTLSGLIHHHASLHARRSAMRDHVQHTDASGNAGDEVLGLLMLIGIGFLAPTLLQDAQRTYAEHLSNTYTQVAQRSAP